MGSKSPLTGGAISSGQIKNDPKKKKIVIATAVVLGLSVIGLGAWAIHGIITPEPEIAEGGEISEGDSGNSSNNSSGGNNSGSGGTGTNNNASEAVESTISELFNFTKSELKRRNISVDSSIAYKQIDNTPFGDWRDLGIAMAYRPTGFNFNVVPERSFMYYFSDIPGWGVYSSGVPVSETERQHLEELKRKIFSMGLTNLNTIPGVYGAEQFGKNSIICHITASFARCADKSWFNAKDYTPFVEAAKERWGNDFFDIRWTRFLGKISQSDSPVKPFQRAILGDDFYFWRANSSSKWVMMDGTSNFGLFPDCDLFDFNPEDARKAFFGTPCYGENGKTTVGA